MLDHGLKQRAWLWIVGFVLLVSLAIIGEVAAAPFEKPDQRQVTHVYKQVGDRELTAYVFYPPGMRADERRTAVVFFHGGGWHIGEPEWCFRECRHLADRGLVAASIEYRLVDGESVTPLDSMADARSAIRWVRSHARDLGVDPDRIVGAGSSSGGHLAAAAAMIEGVEDSREDQEISSVPDALMLWFPAVDLAADPWFARLIRDHDQIEACSPVSHVREGLSPSIVFQGDQDDLTPLKGAQLFSDELKQAGNRCDLHLYRGRGHLFTRDRRDFQDTMQKAEDFLTSLGYLESPADEPPLDGPRRPR